MIRTGPLIHNIIVAPQYVQMVAINFFCLSVSIFVCGGWKLSTEYILNHTRHTVTGWGNARKETSIIISLNVPLPLERLRIVTLDTYHYLLPGKLLTKVCKMLQLWMLLYKVFKCRTMVSLTSLNSKRSIQLAWVTSICFKAYKASVISLRTWYTRMAQKYQFCHSRLHLCTRS